jgi:transcriptional regulator GlxA family with amidase domain
MTELEQVSGLSERGLQYAFRRRFNCTPMAWVRQQRLAMAQALLRDPHGPVTVAAIALQTGFASASLFARHYRQHFGELPSETRLRTRWH